MSASTSALHPTGGLAVKVFPDARPYEAPNHRGIVSLRLQGFEQGGPRRFWIGLSHVLPGGGAGPDASPLEKVYVILSGRIAVAADGQEQTLGPLDSCCIAPGTQREFTNPGNEVATILVVMPYSTGDE